MLHIYLLGQPRLVWDSQPLPLAAPPKTLPLCAYLLLHRDTPIKRAALSYILWPDSPEKEARANLRRHIHYLQKMLPASEPGWLRMDGDSIQWNADTSFWLDVAEFERLSAGQAALAQAIDLYNGDLLSNVYDDWVYIDRERLRDIYLGDLSQLVYLERSRRNYPQAVVYAQMVLACDPMREDIVRQLIALRYESGDRAGALHDYEQFAGQLHRELGVEPMPETRLLYEAVYRNTRLPGAAAEARPAESRYSLPSFSMPFTGRDNEMGVLTALWQQAAAGKGGLALVSGEAGVGKTRLVCELALRAEGQGGRVLSGGTAPGEPRPYQAVTEALESVLSLLSAIELKPTWLAAIAPLIPGISANRSLPSLPMLNPERERDRLFEALASCFQRLSEPRPLLLLLEDLHWAGEASVALLERLARTAASKPILVVATYRGEETGRSHPLRLMRRSLEWERLVRHISLERLTPDSVVQLLQSLPELEKPPQSLVASIQSKSEGNPLFIEHLIYQRLEAKHASDTIPDGIQALIQQRLECLSPGARSLAEVAATVGTSFDIETVQEASGWDENEAISALSELLDHRLAREAGGKGPFGLAFTHHLIQSVIYAGIPEQRLKRWHLRVGQVMEELYPGRSEELAGELGRHFALGGNAGQAIPYLLAAARRATALYAGEEALRFVSQALDLLEGQAVFEDVLAGLQYRWDLLSMREDLVHRSGDREAQKAVLDQMEETARQAKNPGLELECLLRRASCWHIMGLRQLEADAVAELKRSAASTNHPRWQAEAIRTEAALQVALGQCSDVKIRLEQAIQLYRSIENVPGQVSCCCLLAEAEVQQGHFDQVQAHLDEAHRLAELKGDYSLLVQALRAASGAIFARQDFTTAQRLALQSLDLCRAIGDREGEADALARLGAVSTRLFCIEGARQYYAQARDLYHALGKRQGQAAVLVNTGILDVRLGRYTEGQGAFERAGALFEALEDLRGQAVCALNLCMAAFFRGEYAAARSAARDGLDLAHRMQSQVMEANALSNLGAAERELGELNEAIAHMEAGMRLHRSLGQSAELGTDLCDLVIAYLRRGSLDAARFASSEMMEIYAQDAQAMVHPQYILWAAALVSRAGGDQTGAEALLKQACTVMQEKSAAIPDDESRATFLELPFNREIRLACQQGIWP
ncbi:MAG: hypothetical protein EHM70_13215 [Chloroflexota bacterium]|nr:MAG: hypothetical protein EHM70_13215 [Chloroflexota bacterium]